jgi:hypothetical protein
MKAKFLLILPLALFSSFLAKATDICVNENGNGGCYTTISAAISAATNGDRIIINPKAGGAPYVENLVVNKTLQFLCAADTEKYYVQGSISITPALGRSITFIGLKQVGNFGASTASPAGARCVVNIMSSEITGDVNFDFDNYNFTMAATVLNGGLGFRYGRVIGNLISATMGFYGNYYSAVYQGNDATATNDTNLVIGNRITYNPNAPYYSAGIEFNSSSQFFYAANNLITINGNSYAGNTCGIRIDQMKNSALSRDNILNNTITSAFGVFSGIYFNTAPANAYADVYNNLILTGTPSYGCVANANGTIGVSYTVSNQSFYNSIVNPTNIVNSGTTLDPTGRPNPGSDAINGGSPDYSYYDVNLTVNDAGAFGGSLTLDNFFPINSSARVYMVTAPRRVNVSGTINIKADALDR